MANRYDNGTVSKFNPLTLNEILLAPTVMREKHDKSIAAAEALRIKANPLDKHLNRTLELKNQMDSEIARNVDELNSKGYNPVTFQNIVKLNRQYQDLTSPTGEVGQINNAKIVYDTEKANFLKSAEAQKIGSDRALELWNNKTSNYTGFGEDGKSITNVTPQGVAAFQDYDKEKQIAHSLLGKTVKGVSSSGHHLEPDGNGGYWEVTKNGKRVKSENTQQIEAAKKAFKQSWLHGEGANYVRDAGLNIDENRIENDFNSMLEISDVSDVSENANYNKPDSSTNDNSQYSVIGEDYNTQEVGGNKQNFSELARIGTVTSIKDLLPVYDENGVFDKNAHRVNEENKKYRNKAFSVEDIKDLRQRSAYENMFKKLSTTGITGANGNNIKLKEDFIKKGMNDPEVAKTVLKHLKEKPAITLTSKLLTANQLVNSQGFVAGLGTNADDVDKNIRRQLQMTNNEARKLVDPETGQTMTFNDAAKEYGIENINDVNYQGQISAHNWEENENLGSNSKFSPHVVTIKTKKGWKTFKTTRLRSDNLGGNPARMNDLTTNYREATLNHGDWINFKSDSPKLKDIRIKYNPNEYEVDQYTGEPKSWEIEFKNGKVEKTTEGKYMNWVNSL